jgi:BolA family transcriptional regulator, general stress-responsive regulator
MTQASRGPVATQMLARLTAALAPTRLVLTDDSEAHRGHGGHNPAGESHFSLDIASAAFAGQSRVARQRLVYRALGDLMDDRVHALSIKAEAPAAPDGAKPPVAA